MNWQGTEVYIDKRFLTSLLWCHSSRQTLIFHGIGHSSIGLNVTLLIYANDEILMTCMRWKLPLIVLCNLLFISFGVTLVLKCSQIFLHHDSSENPGIRQICHWDLIILLRHRLYSAIWSWIDGIRLLRRFSWVRWPFLMHRKSPANLPVTVQMTSPWKADFLSLVFFQSSWGSAEMLFTIHSVEEPLFTLITIGLSKWHWIRNALV